jgi:hypothetical protein
MGFRQPMRGVLRKKSFKKGVKPFGGCMNFSAIGRKNGNKKIFFSLVGVILMLSGCYAGAYRADARPVSVSAPQRQPPLSTQVYFYPREGQTKEQQGRDHYECYNWAVKETKFDPATSEVPMADRVRLVPMPPPGHDTATLAIAGAVLGAILGGRRNAPGGAIIGATGGAIIGAASDSARQEAVMQRQDAYAAQERAMGAQFAEKEMSFRRAMSACLEGRGYSVK